MRQRDFCGHSVSAVALGSTEFGGTTPEGLAHDLMDAFFALGGNFIDTAHVYGDFKTPKNGEAERVIGRRLAALHNRGQIFISTKGGHPPLTDMTASRLDRASLLRDLSESLDALQTDHADIFWLHRDDPRRPVGDILETLQELLERGMTRLVGCSNWTRARIEEANHYAAAHALTPFCANQPRFSLAVQELVEDPTLVAMDSDLYKMHLDTGMPCVCFSSQAKGFFTKLDALGIQGLPEKTRRRYYTPHNLAVYERLKEIRDRTGISINTLATAWLTAQPFPTFPLIGTSRVAQVQDMLAAADTVIDEETRDAIAKVL